VLHFVSELRRGADPTTNSEFLAAAFVVVHEAHENIVFGEVPHDVLAIHAAALAQQHHAHLL
jgi:hypothetical protein